MSVLSALSPDPPPTRPVVVAPAALPAGATLAAADLVVAQWPLELVPEGATDDPGSLIGRQIAVRRPSGALLTTADLTGSGLGGEPGEVLVPFRVEDAAVAGLLQVGDRIEIVADDFDGVPQVVAAAARVAALPTPESGGGLVGGSSSGGALVVAAVPAESGPALAAAASQGRLGVILLTS